MTASGHLDTRLVAKVRLNFLAWHSLTAQEFNTYTLSTLQLTTTLRSIYRVVRLWSQLCRFQRKSLQQYRFYMNVQLDLFMYMRFSLEDGVFRDWG